MVQEPAFAFPLTDGKSCVCLQGDKYIAYLDRDAAIELLYSLFWFAREKPMGEEVDIWSRDWKETPCQGKRIGLCEFHLVEAHTHKKQGKTILKQALSLRQKQHGVYRHEYDRLDYYVTPEEANVAYETLTALLQGNHNRRGTFETVLFDTLIVRLDV